MKTHCRQALVSTKNISIIACLFFTVLVFTVSSLKAQKTQKIGEREISLYRVSVKTNKGMLKGLFQHAGPDHIIILTERESTKIAVTIIKSLKIKFDKKRNVPVFQNIAQTGLDIIVDPEYTRSSNNTGQDIYGNPTVIDDEEASLGEQVLMGGVLIGGALLGNEISKLVPPATIETFKINYSKETYESLYDNLSMYSVDMQSSPEYEQILKRKLKETMQKHKPTI
ncbi:hypothetical protein DI53_1277 [Sphingobacterium deserti]|uniref:Uncharacterized protein n=2 Tax=Sphingobacterium deserti TaxID=1229276 RepID=A0A0B8TAD5_9SPHI|nr:hypothetical protein DI53_1277 [Sphingobacterium deserti]